MLCVHAVCVYCRVCGVCGCACLIDCMCVCFFASLCAGKSSVAIGTMAR